MKLLQKLIASVGYALTFTGGLANIVVVSATHSIATAHERKPSRANPRITKPEDSLRRKKVIGQHKASPRAAWENRKAAGKRQDRTSKAAVRKNLSKKPAYSSKLTLKQAHKTTEQQEESLSSDTCPQDGSSGNIYPKLPPGYFTPRPKPQKPETEAEKEAFDERMTQESVQGRLDCDQRGREEEAKHREAAAAEQTNKDTEEAARQAEEDRAVKAKAIKDFLELKKLAVIDVKRRRDFGALTNLGITLNTLLDRFQYTEGCPTGLHKLCCDIKSDVLIDAKSIMDRMTEGWTEKWEGPNLSADLIIPEQPPIQMEEALALGWDWGKLQDLDILLTEQGTLGELPDSVFSLLQRIKEIARITKAWTPSEMPIPVLGLIAPIFDGLVLHPSLIDADLSITYRNPPPVVAAPVVTIADLFKGPHNASPSEVFSPN